MLKNGITYLGMDGNKKAVKVQRTFGASGNEIAVTFGTYGIGDNSQDVLWDTTNTKFFSGSIAKQWLKNRTTAVLQKYAKKLINGAKHTVIDTIKRFTNKSYYTIINNIEWSSEHLWEMRCSELPKPFKTFCPVNMATLQLASANTSTMNISNCSFEYITGVNPRTITITFNDDSVGTMQQFFYEWMETITNNGRMGGVTPLESCGKTFTFVRYSRAKKEVGSYTLYCFPKGTLTEDNTQSSKVKDMTIELAVAGVATTFTDYADLEWLQPSLIAWKIERVAKRSKLYQQAKSLYHRGEGIVNTVNGIIG